MACARASIAWAPGDAAIHAATDVSSSCLLAVARRRAIASAQGVMFAGEAPLCQGVFFVSIFCTYLQPTPIRLSEKLTALPRTPGVAACISLSCKSLPERVQIISLSRRQLEQASPSGTSTSSAVASRKLGGNRVATISNRLVVACCVTSAC